MAGEIGFSELGIGSALNNYTLAVPLNQRSYAWEQEHVTDLFADLENAITSPDTPYFLGTMVFTKLDMESLEVADGQQRLATTAILLAAIRDHLHQEGGHDQLISDIETRYLSSYDMSTDDIVPKISLNVSDNDYFRNTILRPPNHDKRTTSPNRPSHDRIKRAADTAKQQVSKIIGTPRPTDQLERIIQWVKYIRTQARVIMVIVADHGKAFTIFETLNDRGLKLSQVDLLKNYLYGLAQQSNRLPEAAERWDSMVGAIEATGYGDLILDYIRHLWISYYGHVRVGDLYDRIRDKVKAPNNAIEFAGLLQDDTTPYLAILNPAHPHWNKYTDRTKKCVEIITVHLRIDRIRPLMLAIVRKMSPKDVERCFELCVSWTVRFLIVGGIGSGTIEKWYAEQSQRISDGKLSTPADLAKAMRKVAPPDEKFQSEFATATVSRNYIARYYLRALELQHRQQDSILIPDDDSEKVNLEHVMPQKPGEDWKIDKVKARLLVKRIGNLALLDKTTNSNLKSESFQSKREAYKGCPLELTSLIAEFADWGETEIVDRQKELSELAVKTWPMTVPP